jgi:hypothetical protein
MRTSVLFAAVVSLLAASLSVHAGQLNIAILTFADERDQASVEEALDKIDLMKITDSDRTETSVRGLRGGNVVFVQSLPASIGTSFASSTRLDNMRADVSGSLGGSGVSVKVMILEGVKVGLRKHREWTYEGRGSLAGGGARLISFRQSTGTSMTMVKDRQKTITYSTTTVMLAQYIP